MAPCPSCSILATGKAVSLLRRDVGVPSELARQQQRQRAASPSRRGSDLEAGPACCGRFCCHGGASAGPSSLVSLTTPSATDVADAAGVGSVALVTAQPPLGPELVLPQPGRGNSKQGPLCQGMGPTLARCCAPRRPRQVPCAVVLPLALALALPVAVAVAVVVAVSAAVRLLFKPRKRPVPSLQQQQCEDPRSPSSSPFLVAALLRQVAAPPLRPPPTFARQHSGRRQCTARSLERAEETARRA